MNFTMMFFLNSLLFGLGLAVDAFLISLSNGMNAPAIGRGKIFAAACVFALFQFIAPMIGWVCIHTVARRFELFEECLSWLALIVLCYIGVKMIVEGLCRGKKVDVPKVGVVALLVQALITSVDALSVGFAIADESWQMALVGSAIIASVTFVAYVGGFCLGRRFGTKFAGKASVIGGLIFIVIGIEVFVNNIF